MKAVFPLSGVVVCLVAIVGLAGGLANDAQGAEFRVAVFRADATIPLGHRCMGVLPTKSTRIVDPLELRGLVLLGPGQPLVIAVFDWCEIRNDSYDLWRQVIADAAGTSRERVLLSCNHQHDAPVIDAGAERLLREVGLAGELFDEAFQQRMVERVTRAVRDALGHARPVTHLGIGEARVEKIASSRRVVDARGRVSYARGSGSGTIPAMRDAPEGAIDPMLKMISFWNGDRPVVALSCYATHPMSYYGQGEVSWDFVGIARHRMQQKHPDVFQVYVTGCSGDVTAGKYNRRTPEDREALANRLLAGMEAAWKTTRRTPLKEAAFRLAHLELDFHPSPSLTEQALRSRLEDTKASVEARILAAMGLASRRRVAAGRLIDVPAIDLGEAKIVLLPGEAFVAYQRMAQSMRPDATVMTIGYGECWPGYIPTDADFRDGFRDKWLWVAPGSEARVRRALQEVLRP